MQFQVYPELNLRKSLHQLVLTKITTNMDETQLFVIKPNQSELKTEENKYCEKLLHHRNTFGCKYKEKD